MIKHLACYAVAFAIAFACCVASPAYTLEKIISHENPAFDAVSGRMTIGQDGYVYIWHQRIKTNDGYMLRMKPDGSDKSGRAIHYINNGVAANAQSTFAVAEAHFAQSATIYDKNGKRVGSFTQFNNDNYDAPQHVEAGESGDFYVADARTAANRTVRISPAGKLVASYPLGGYDFRVAEKKQQLYILKGTLQVIGFDGEKKWTAETGAVFDVDDQGQVYFIGALGDKVTVLSAESGKSVREITLQMGEHKPQSNVRISDLRVKGNELFIKRSHASELFSVYDLTSGAFKRAVSIDFDRLAATLPSETLTAGDSLPFKLEYSSSTNIPAPHWHVWARPFGAPGYEEWSLQNGQLKVPEDAGGLYQFQVSPEVDPQQRRVATEYAVRSVVEVRAPQSKGTVNVFSPDNRAFYGRGEVIPLSVLVRSAAADRPSNVALRIEDRANRVLLQTNLAMPQATAAQYSLPGSFTAALRPGLYSIKATAPGLTAVEQRVLIGPGVQSDMFLRTQYGDYGLDMRYDGLDPWNAPDIVEYYARRTSKLGFNMIVERIGPTHLSWDGNSTAALEEITKRLEKDPVGTAPEKARIASPFLQALGAYGAFGIHHTPMLLGNDSNIALGTGFDARKPERLAEDITVVTKAMVPFAAFRGWNWAANWWAGGDDPFKDAPERKKEYDGAVAKARETGQWNPIIDQYAAFWPQKAAEATKLFNDALKKIAGEKKTSVAGPYRNIAAYPPITFSNVDEVDLQFQAEQLYAPYAYMQDTDFYKRPGKKAWAHPEIWNDSGTGEQILREYFGLAMRGADGVGTSGGPGWTANDIKTGDSRLAYNGTMSVFRAADEMLADYGPWLSTLQKNDRVAIIASRRMLMIDEWTNTWPRHFARIKEAFISCLHAHHPASIVFTDDIQANTLNPYKAVLIVGQRVEMEPALKSALSSAKNAGTQILYDSTCREEFVKEYSPLGVGFNHFELDPHTWGDDPGFASYRFPSYIEATRPTLQAKLDAAMQPIVKTDNSEVLASERTSGAGRFIFLVNDTTPPHDPGQLWRQNLFVASRVPVTASITLNADNATVYDMTAMRPASGTTIQADLRTLPTRIYAILPASIARVGLRGPKSLSAGQAFNWGVWVQDAAGQAINTAIPVRVRLLGADGSTLDARSAAANSKDGAQSTFVVPVDAGGALTLEATELVSGKSARLPISITAAKLPLAATSLPNAETGLESRATGTDATSDRTPAEEFGARLRDTVLINNNATAVFNAFNWDNNLFGVDVATGKVLWRERAGQSYAYAPQALQNGFAVQGFDFNSPEGYHLYLANSNGQPERRFALYGLSRRLPFRFLAWMFNDALNRFAVAPDGSWVASHGDLGLAVWSRNGELLWKQDKWKETHNRARWRGIGGWTNARLAPPFLTAIGKSTLLVADHTESVATAFDAQSGKELWHVALPSGAEISKELHSTDGKTIALFSNVESGRVFLLRDNKLVRTIPITGTDFELAPDGSALAVVNSTQLKLFGADGAMRWVLNCDEFMLNPRIAADGRVAASSRLGTLYVLDTAGKVLLQKDTGALAIPTWLPGGDLLVGTWLGRVSRLDGKGTEKWSTQLTPSIADMRGKMLAADATPTTKVPDAAWTNAEKTALPLNTNLLNQVESNVYIHVNAGADKPGPEAPKYLTDEKPEPGEQPLAKWGDINWLADAGAENWIGIEFPFHRATINAVTFAEDAAHPESWLHESYLDYWDEAKKEWVYAGLFMANSATHSHRLPQAVSSQKFRIVLPPGLVGNLRLGEVAVHGKVEDLLGTQIVFDEDEKVDELKDKFTVVENPADAMPQSGKRALKLQANEYGNLQVTIANTAAWTNNKKLTGWYYVPKNQPDGTQLILRFLTMNLEGDAASQGWQEIVKPIQLATADRGKWVKFSFAKADFNPNIPATPVKISIVRAKYTAPETPANYIYLDNFRLE